MQYEAIIYKVTNKINNKIYIGQSKYSLEKRFNDLFIGHFTKAFKTTKNSYFYNALRKYGRDNFTYEVLETRLRTCNRDNSKELKSWLDEREKYWIDFYHSNEHAKGYNQTSGGQRDYRRTKEERERLAYQSKLSMSRPEVRKQISDKVKALWKNPQYREAVLSHKPKKEKKITRKDKNLSKNRTVQEALYLARRKGVKLSITSKMKNLIRKEIRLLITYLHSYFVIKFGPDYRLKAFNISQKGKRKNIQRKLTFEQELERCRKISKNSRWKTNRTPEEQRIHRNKRRQLKRKQRRLIHENKI